MRLCVECLQNPTRAQTPQARYCSTSCRDRANHKRRTAVKDDISAIDIDRYFHAYAAIKRHARWRAA